MRMVVFIALQSHIATCDLSMQPVGQVVAFSTKPTSQTGNICGPIDTQATQGWGAAYAWCSSLLAKHARERKLVGLSYGILNFDTWSERLGNVYEIPTFLYDCFATNDNPGNRLKQYKVPYKRYSICLGDKEKTDPAGRQWQTLAQHLTGRKQFSVALKLDIEGSEWNAFDTVSDEALQTIFSLDMEVHFCNEATLPEPYRKNKDLFYKKMAHFFARILKYFVCIGRAPDQHDWIKRTVTECRPQTSVTMLSVSYIHKAIFNGTAAG